MSKEKMDEGFSEDYHEKNPFKLNRQLNIHNQDDITRLRLLQMKSNGNISINIKPNGNIHAINIHTQTFEDRTKTLENFDDSVKFTDSTPKLHLFNCDIPVFTRGKDDQPKCHVTVLCEDNPKHAKILEELKNEN